MTEPKVGDESTCTSCGHKIVFTGECWDHASLGNFKPKHPASPPGSPLAEHVETQPHAGQGTGDIRPFPIQRGVRKRDENGRIKRLAKKAGMSVSAYVRGLIINHLSEQGELGGLTVRGNQKAAGDGGSVEVQSSYCKISVKDVS